MSKSSPQAGWEGQRLVLEGFIVVEYFSIGLYLYLFACVLYLYLLAYCICICLRIVFVLMAIIARGCEHQSSPS